MENYFMTADRMLIEVDGKEITVRDIDICRLQLAEAKLLKNPRPDKRKKKPSTSQEIEGFIITSLAHI